MNPVLLASLILVIGASAWGVYWVPVRAIEATGIENGWAVVVFNAPALAVAMIAPFFLGSVPARANRLIIIAGAMAGAGLAFYAMGLVLTTVVRATLLFYLTPVWSTVLAILFLRERPGLARWAALTLGIAGLGLTLGATPDDIASGFGVGEALGLISGVVWAIAAVIIRRIGEIAPPSRAIDARLVLHQFIWVIFFAAVGSALMGDHAPTLAEGAAALTPMVLAFSLFILASLYAIFWAIGRLSPGRSGLLMMSEVVVAVITASLLLPEEAMNAREWIGAGLIISAGLVEVFGGARGEPDAG